MVDTLILYCHVQFATRLSVHRDLSHFIIHRPSAGLLPLETCCYYDPIGVQIFELCCPVLCCVVSCHVVSCRVVHFIFSASQTTMESSARLRRPTIKVAGQ